MRCNHHHITHFLFLLLGFSGFSIGVHDLKGVRCDAADTNGHKKKPVFSWHSSAETIGDTEWPGSSGNPEACTEQRLPGGLPAPDADASAHQTKTWAPLAWVGAPVTHSAGQLHPLLCFGLTHGRLLTSTMWYGGQHLAPENNVWLMHQKTCKFSSPHSPAFYSQLYFSFVPFCKP